MKRVWIAVSASAVVVLLALWLGASRADDDGPGSLSASPVSPASPEREVSSSRSSSPSSSKVPTSKRQPLSPLFKRFSAATKAPENLDAMDVISADELIRLDEPAFDAIQTGMDELGPALIRCAMHAEKLLDKPAVVSFSIVLDAFALEVSTDAGSSTEAQIAAIDSVEWPQEFDDEVVECFHTAVEGYTFPAPHSFAYRMAYPMKLGLGAGKKR